MRHFVVIGQRASASPEFLLQDLPGTSGRLDVLLRCVRACLLLSHGVRKDTIVYLVLGGGPAAPRVLRFEGERAEYLRPDERSLAVLTQKALGASANPEGFLEVRPGVSVANGGLDVVLRDVGSAVPFVLDEGGRDVRSLKFAGDCVFFVGDHQGFDPAVAVQLAALGATPVCAGPLSVHAEDAITIVTNELDRQHQLAARSNVW